MGSSDERLRRRLRRLGLPLAGGRNRWFGLVEAYTQRYPAVEVQAREAITEQLLDQLVAGELDGALGFAPSRVPSLTYTHVHDEPLLVWLHADDPFAAGRSWSSPISTASV